MANIRTEGRELSMQVRMEMSRLLCPIIDHHPYLLPLWCLTALAVNPLVVLLECVPNLSPLGEHDD